MVSIDSGEGILKLGVWEYITDIAPFDADHAWADQAWRGARERFALAAAAMAALTEDVRRHVPDLRVGIKFVRPSAEIVDEAMINYARRGLDVAPLQSAAATFVGLEAAALEKLASLGVYFTLMTTAAGIWPCRRTTSLWSSTGSRLHWRPPAPRFE